MGVRVFITANSGNKEIENGQQTIFQVLKTRNIEFETIDISAPGLQEMRKFMREKGKKKDGQRYALPPQIFNGEEFRGDFEGFDIANEDDFLEEFLGIPRKNPKAEHVKTGAIAPEVGRLKPGKLDMKEKEKVAKAKNNKEKSNSIDETENTNNISQRNQECENNLENESNWSEANDLDTDSGFKDDTESIDTKSDGDGDWRNGDDSFSNIEDFSKQAEPDPSKNGIGNELDQDNFNKLGVNLDEGHDLLNGDDDDSSDYDSSSDEDNVVEYMPDGEIMRKKSRGFKQLNNCKRFWKASMMLEKV